jgi:AcrR family transcriptional regulator
LPVPRAGLSTAAVVRQAAAIADELGWEQLTLAEVASRCGVRLPSLYKHIASIQGLRQQIGLLALGEMREVLATAAIGRARTDALTAMALAYRRYALAHPGRYASTIAAPAADDAAPPRSLWRMRWTPARQRAIASVALTPAPAQGPAVTSTPQQGLCQLGGSLQRGG